MNSARIFLKLIEFISCICALIVKKLADSYADRVFKRNEKYSVEWTLLHNITWSPEGNDFSTFVFSAFAFISGIYFLSSFNDDIARRPEKLMYIFGVILYIVEGYIIFTSIEYTSDDLHTYAYILGSFSFIIAVLFTLDLMSAFSSNIKHEKFSQTESSSCNFEKVGNTSLQCESASDKYHTNLTDRNLPTKQQYAFPVTTV